MSSVAKENGLLKLVHPGRFVEIHKEPLTAAEVLKNNPRRSITRPDFFEYPWILVKPEAVLNPGKVFFIVPNHTIYRVLKAHMEHYQHSPCQSQQIAKIHGHQQVRKQNFPQLSDAGMIPKHPNHQQCLKKSFPTTFCIGTTFEDQDCDCRLRKESKVDSWSKLISKLKNTHTEFDRNFAKDSAAKTRSLHQKQYHYTDSTLTPKFLENNDCSLEFKCRKEGRTLKSCLRKQESARKLLNLRVSFALPDKNEERPKSISVSGTEFAGHYSCSDQDFYVSSMKPDPTHADTPFLQNMTM